MPFKESACASALRFGPVVALACLCLAVTTIPQESADAEESPVTAETVEQAAPKTATCIACHGEDGNGVLPDYPNLSGQNQAYALHQLRLIKSGEREIAVMAGLLDSMTDEDLQDLALHYASMPGKIGQSDEKLLGLGEAIYRGGILAKEVPACTACHAPNGQGNHLAGFPRIAGQPIAYTVAQLKLYREGLRTSDENMNGMMRAVASRMTDTEMEAVANYVLGLY